MVPHEHLRYATELERSVYEPKNNLLNITRDLRRGQGRQFEDLGDPPSAAERQFAEGDQGEVPMDVDEPGSGGAPASSSAGPESAPSAPSRSNSMKSGRRSAHVDQVDCEPAQVKEK